MQPTLTQRTPEELEIYQAARERYLEAIMQAAEMRFGANQHDGIIMNARIRAMIDVMVMLLGNFPEMREMALRTIWEGSAAMAECVDEERSLQDAK